MKEKAKLIANDRDGNGYYLVPERKEIWKKTVGFRFFSTSEVFYSMKEYLTLSLGLKFVKEEI